MIRKATTKQMTASLGLALLLGAAPAWAQSALAQQYAQQTQQSGSQQNAPQQGTASPQNQQNAPQQNGKSSGSAATTSTAKPAATGTQTSSKSTTVTTASKPAATTAKPAAAKPKPVVKKDPPKPVVYVDNDTSASGGQAGVGANQKETAEVTKAFEQTCPGVSLTEEKAKAGFDVSMEREPGSHGVKQVFGLTNVVHRTNRIEVMSKSGKEVFEETGHSTEQLVKDACAAIEPPQSASRTGI